MATRRRYLEIPNHARRDFIKWSVGLGAALGRMEARVALTGLIRRFPAMRLAVPHAHLRWRQSSGLRGLVELPVLLR